MKSAFQLALIALAMLPVGGRAAVVITELAAPLAVGSYLFLVTEPIDMNADGTIDFTFGASVGFAGLRSERANRIIYRYTPPPDIGGPIPPLPVGFMIESTLASASFGWGSSDFGGGYVDPGEIAFMPFSIVTSTGSSGAFPLSPGLRAPIGIEFEAADGIHYGYFDVISARDSGAVIVYGWAFETTPNTPIIAGSVPEPGRAGFLILGMTPLLRRRRRALGSG